VKQIQLKIEEMFDGRIALDQDISKIKNDQSLINDIFDIIKTKLEWTDNETFFIGSLNPNESRETIIQALLEYQKSLLPNDWIINLPIKHISLFISLATNKLDIFGCPEHVIHFYDPETRIIKITDFEEAESETRA
jgi:hypothetical protein